MTISRYTKSQSRMRPPYYIIKEGARHIAEAWNKEDADLILKALKRYEAARAAEV